MARTRAVVLRAAAAVVADRGTRRASMSDIAAAAGVAKGTLYNHFRTKDEVWSALVGAELAALADECRGLPLVVALAHAAQRVGAHPAIRRLAADEPATFAALLDPDGRHWPDARAAVAAALTAAGKDPAGNGLAGRDLAGNGPAGNGLAGRDPAGNGPAGNGLAGKDPAGNGLAGNGPARHSPGGHTPAGKGSAADLVLRWLASHLANPSTHDATGTAELLAATLPDLDRSQLGSVDHAQVPGPLPS